MAAGYMYGYCDDEEVEDWIPVIVTSEGELIIELA